jgi:endonuclease/exonuclease/phosphatase family metal-dependent hydrolase
MAKQCILLLQEVDAAIEAMGLYELLCERGYVFLSASTTTTTSEGQASEGQGHGHGFFHDCVLAFPSSRYQATELCKERIGLGVPSAPLGLESWENFQLCREARARGRLMPWACLTDLLTRQRFCVFGIHMICGYARPKLMALHLEPALRRCYELSRGMPFVLAGDFNMLPGSSLYRLATTGAADADCAPWPGFEVCPVVDHLANFPGLVSNRTPEFAGRIDYVFSSPGWTLRAFCVESLAEAAPNAKQGSDHAPVCCELELSRSLSLSKKSQT